MGRIVTHGWFLRFFDAVLLKQASKSRVTRIVWKNASGISPLFSYDRCILQVISYWNGFYEFAPLDKGMQVRFGLKVVLEWWDKEFLGNWTIFQKKGTSAGTIASTKRVSDISETLDFWGFIPQKGASHFGARDDPTIRVRNFFSELGLLRLWRPVRLQRLMRL